MRQHEVLSQCKNRGQPSTPKNTKSIGLRSGPEVLKSYPHSTATLPPPPHIPLLLKCPLPLKSFLALPLLFPLLVLEYYDLALKLL